MTLLPFTLDGWRSGLVPCTADGREVKQLTLFECDQGYPLIGVVDGDMLDWDTNGDHRNSSYKERYLRLRPKTEKRWVVIIRDPNSVVDTALLWPPHLDGKHTHEIARVEIEVPV